MLPHAVIFGSIGSIAETSELQRRAFNEAFAMLDVDVYWSRADYRERLSASGGRRRIRAALGERADDALVETLYRAKNERFHELLVEGDSVLRPGFEALVRDLAARGVRLAIASTTQRATVELVLESARRVYSNDFDVILSIEDVSRPKPDPEVYRVCTGRLGVEPTFALAVEDSVPSLSAAVAAGLRTAAVPGANTRDQDFASADLVCTDLKSLHAALSAPLIPSLKIAS